MEKTLKIAFFGTPEFSVKILEALRQNNFMPILVITESDKLKGRKLKMAPSPVKEWTQRYGIPVQHHYDNLKSIGADLFIVASFGKILPKEALEIPKYGTLNVHPSLLPKLRGASPIQGAILSGEKETGVTIMLMNEKMDEGPILSKSNLVPTGHLPKGDKSLPADATHQALQAGQISNLNYKELENELAELGGELLVETIPKWIAGAIKPQPQENEKATYTKKITKEDGLIDWNEPAEIIERKIRAFTLWPGTYTFVNGKRLIITKAELINNSLKIKAVKPEGKKEMPFTDFLRGNSAPSLEKYR